MTPFVKVFKEAVIEEGKSKLEDKQKEETNPIDYAKSILDLRQQYHDILSKQLDRDVDFEKAVKDAFAIVINDNKKFCDYLALMAHSVLCNSTSSWADLETTFDRIIDVFSFLQDKDIFEICYKTHLAQVTIVQQEF